MVTPLLGTVFKQAAKWAMAKSGTQQVPAGPVPGGMDRLLHHEGTLNTAASWEASRERF